MKISEAAKIIGQTKSIDLSGLIVEVKVLDYKNSYGKDRWLVTPISGSGEVWVEANFTA